MLSGFCAFINCFAHRCLTEFKGSVILYGRGQYGWQETNLLRKSVGA